MKYVREVWRVLLLLIFFWRKPEPLPPVSEPEPAPEPEPEPAPVLESPAAPPAQPCVPPPEPPPVYADWYRRGKWVKPKGLDSDLPEHKEPPPAKSRLQRPQLKPKLLPPRPEDDPERWGQYYFRDVILDQLGIYWIYLRRMKRGDNDSYKLLRQTGIQLMPYAATRFFDKWRDDEEATLSPWWYENRPAFGAVAYGFDDVSAEADRITVGEIADPNYADDPAVAAEFKRSHELLDGAMKHRPLIMLKPGVKYDREKVERPRVIWTPRFLYFGKYTKPPLEFEQIEGDGDTYKLTVYWDRCDKKAPKRFRSNRAGGVPQEYGVWVERGTGRVRVLKTKLHQRITLRWSRGPRGGKSTGDIAFVQTLWTVPDRYLRWSHQGGGHHEPEDYLRRLFIEAASMFKSSVLGSMIRVSVSKSDLTATFGVDIKRTPYFFRDRDVVLNDKGTKKRIFHIVRPHVRANGDEVPMHFRGLRNFTWAGYGVAITVPGRDHLFLTDFDVGFYADKRQLPKGDHGVGSEKVGKMLVDMIKEGKGAVK